MKRRSSAAVHETQFCPRRAAAILACLFIFSSAGCAVVGEEFVVDEPIRDDQVRLIRNGVTGKKEVLHWFGPPAAMISNDEAFPPAVPDAVPGTAAVPGFYRAAGPAALSEKNRQAGIPQRLRDAKPPDGTIYCYSAYKYTWADICFGYACFPTRPVLKQTRLWLLFDKSGTVIDHEVEPSRNKGETREEQGESGLVQPGLSEGMQPE